MDKRNRLFIYDRREMFVLILLSVMVALFAFTLGVHLGKRVSPGPDAASSKVIQPTEPVETQEDSLPNRQDLSEQAPAADPAADEALGRSLHEEVARSGIQLDRARPIELPQEKVKSAVRKGMRKAKPPSSAAPQAVPVPTLTPTGSSNNAANGAVKPAEKNSETFGETAANPAVAASRREAPPGRYTLQVGSFPSLDDARASVEALETVGLRPFLRGVEIPKKGRWFRIYLGGYANREEAQLAGKRYVSEQMIESYLVANRVN